MNYKIPYAVPYLLEMPDLADTAFDSEIGARFDRFVYERISGQFALEEIWREAEECFIDQYDDEYVAGMWRSEFWGKLLLSAVRVCRMKKNARLKEEIRASVYRILACQKENGYLSTYRNEDAIMMPDLQKAKAQLGWECYFCWNIWGQKYTLWALLECAQYLNDGYILTCCQRMADHLLAQLDRLGVKLTETGTMHGMASGSIMKPMLVLYRLTGKQEYLDLCISTAAEWDRDDNLCPNLIRNALSDVPPSQWYYLGEMGATWYAKAYEMMSSFDGLCELYRVTGNGRYLDAVKGLWELLNKYEANILGSVGYCEQFRDGKAQCDTATEVCDVIHWMRISHELFRMTGEPKYMEAMEKGFLNAFLAGVYEDGKNGAFFVRGAGRHWTAEPQVETKYQHCCVNNAARGFTNMAESIMMADGDGYYVNSYIPSRLHFGKTSFRISRGYVDNGSVSIIVRDAEVGKVIKLRIPTWSPKAVMKVNCAPTEVDGGGYYVVPVSEPDMLIQVQFNMTPEVIDFAGEFVDYPDTDYHRNRWIDPNAGLCDRGAMLYHPMSVIRRGPVLLARSKRLGCASEDMFSGETVFGKERTCTARAIRHDRMLVACKVHMDCDGKAYDYLMCDFASAANMDLEDPRYFSLYI